MDPGTSKVGLSLFVEGVLEDFRLVKSSASGGAHRRSLVLAGKVEGSLIEMLGFAKTIEQPECVIELPGSQSRANVKSLVGIGIGLGTMNLVAANRGFRIHYAKVAEWSRLAGGVSKSKEDRAVVIRHMFPAYAKMKDDGLDVADAIGIAAYHLGMFEGRREEIDAIISSASG